MSSLTLTGVAVVLIVIGNKQGIVLAGLGLIGGESLVLDFVELDHFGGVCVIGGIEDERWMEMNG